MTRTSLVLGAGIVGVSCALALQKRGFMVTLIDRREPGSETSYGNAGVVSPTSVVPLNNPSLWKSLPNYLGNQHAAVRYRWGHLLGNPGWVLRFLAEARPSRLAPRVAALQGLTAQALTLHKAWMAEAGISHRLRETGTLKLWRSEAGQQAARTEQQWLEDHGFRADYLDRQALSAVEPDLNPIFSAGLWLRDNGSVDWPQAVVAAYAALFVARGGTIIRAAASGLSRTHQGWRATTDSGSFDADLAVVALGPWSADLLRPLGLSVPLNVERGYHRHYRASDGRSLSRPFYDVESAYFLAPMEKGYRLTSGVELANRDAPSNFAQIDAVLPRAKEAFDLTEATEATTWRGARPTLPDSLPMIGEAPRNPGLWLAFGSQHIGFATGPVTGEILAALICGERPIADPEPFAPARYL
ncbi:putative D-amino-acid dehydrogenase, FAD dependent [Bosea sp. LC85]|uniref:NAD(P)/FAD-dependent oxidoreductase n=1 Tax=Bosea sp. LC85 TaxID=1502851 RepID=UPI0004E36A96|nr:FAD-dependent oxidoreductase [Bosea sp. LC85]KFC63407.1 putative D-amino-acid dehydrogenase, FAD dependent [Bosea sp. LC85]